MCVVWYLVLGFLALPGPSCSNSDNLALLLDTLKVIHRTVCNDDMVSLACPRGTTISIQVAQYGRASEEHGCVATSKTLETEAEKNCKRPNALQLPEVPSALQHPWAPTEITKNLNVHRNNNDISTSNTSVQPVTMGAAKHLKRRYSLLQTVVEACQKKPSCRFSTVPKGDLVDPCPSQGKYVEVAYKCRPYEFRSRTGCEGEVIKLSCNPHSRIAIFDAQYGRTAYESVTCFPAQGIPDETCLASHADKTVMHLCLGRRRCQIAATNRTFNSSCRPQSRPYLKVIYACVPLGVLSEKYESAAERDETSRGNTGDDTGDLFDESEESGEKWGEPNADHALQPPLLEETVTQARPDNELTNTDSKESKEDIVETTHDRSSSPMFLIYISIGIIVFIILIGILISVRYYISRRSNNSKNGDMYTTEAPNVFNDAFSDIDNDGDISHISGTFHDPVHPDMILYKNVPGSRGTIRAMKPLCTIYPTTIEANMYGVDYVPPQTRDVAPRFARSRNNEEEMDSNVMTSPRSLGAHSNSHYYYG